MKGKSKMTKKTKYLTTEYQDKVQEYVKTIEIDVQELETYRYHPAIGSESRWSAPEDSTWDEDEELLEQYKTFRKYIVTDGADYYINPPKEIEDNEAELEIFNKEILDYVDWCIEYIEEQINEYPYRYY